MNKICAKGKRKKRAVLPQYEQIVGGDKFI